MKLVIARRNVPPSSLRPDGKIFATIGGVAGDTNAEQALAVVQQLAANIPKELSHLECQNRWDWLPWVRSLE